MTNSILEQISYNSRDFISIELGIQTVNPLDIIGLSRQLDGEKLSALRRKIEENGWQNIEPQGLSLNRLPDQSYIVNAGGNHRTFLCNEFGRHVEGQEHGPIESRYFWRLFRFSVQVFVPGRGQELVPIAEKDKNMFRLPI